MEELTDVSIGNATIIKASPINAQRMNLATSSYAFFIWHLSWLCDIRLTVAEREVRGEYLRKVPGYYLWRLYHFHNTNRRQNKRTAA